MKIEKITTLRSTTPHKFPLASVHFSEGPNASLNFSASRRIPIPIFLLPNLPQKTYRSREAGSRDGSGG